MWMKTPNFNSARGLTYKSDSPLIQDCFNTTIHQQTPSSEGKLILSGIPLSLIKCEDYNNEEILMYPETTRNIYFQLYFFTWSSSHEIEPTTKRHILMAYHDYFSPILTWPWMDQWITANFPPPKKDNQVSAVKKCYLI